MSTDSDAETGASYYYVSDAPVARTVSVNDVIMVDVDASGGIIGVELAVPVADVSRPEWNELYAAYPELRGLVPAFGLKVVNPRFENLTRVIRVSSWDGLIRTA